MKSVEFAKTICAQPNAFIGWTSGDITSFKLKTPEEIYAGFVVDNPWLKKFEIELASGYPFDSKGPATSDIDLVLFFGGLNKKVAAKFGVTYDSLASLFTDKMKVDHRPEKGQAIYTPADSVERYGREINLCVGVNKSILRSVRHAAIEKELTEKFPRLAEKVIALKRAGEKTEPAWVKVLGLKSASEADNPYEMMLRPREELIAAAKKA